MLSAAEAVQLDRFALGGGLPAASSAGRRPTRARGCSVEFHDFRRYQPGDDPRAIDWTVDARLRQLVIRRYRAEGHVPLHLLVDSSASMQIGNPSKLSAASRLAAALAYVAVLRRDPVAVATFDDRIRAHVAAAAGRPQLFRIFEALQAAPATGTSSLDRALTDYGSTVRGPGLAVVISDLFDRDSRLDGIRFLLYRGFAVSVMQVLAGEEIDPVIDDDAEMVDVERPGDPPVRVDRDAAAAYRARLDEFTAGIRSFCARHGVSFVPIRAGAPFGETVAACSAAGLLELHG
jgi:uncharacterized protein (DUF58 family)